MSELSTCMRLGGCRALVTGAAGGIGQAIAVELAAQGARVAIHAARSDPSETLVALGDRGAAFAGDLRSVEACRGVVERAAGWLGGLDVLVNCAGLTVVRDFLTIEQETFDDVFSLNIRGYFFCAQAAARLMRDRQGGSIVNISSVHGQGGFAGHSVYAAAMGAINALTRQLAIELAPSRIRVN